MESQPTIAAFEYASFYSEAYDLYKKHMPRHYTAPISHNSALQLLRKDKACSKKGATSCAYLLAAFQIFCQFVGKGNSQELEGLAVSTFQQLCKGDTNQSASLDYAALFAEYLFACIGDESLIPIRAQSLNCQNVQGWYDGKKDFIYLPYTAYYENFSNYLRSTKDIILSLSKKDFQTKVLFGAGLVTPKDNGTKSRYLRYSAQIVVAPINQEAPPKETVIKINVNSLLKLASPSIEIQNKLQEWDKNPLQRRHSTARKD